MEAKNEYVILVCEKQGCSCCVDTKNCLKKNKKKYVTVDSLKDKDFVDKLTKILGIKHPTYPKIFKIKFIGGNDDLQKKYKE